MVRMRGSEPEGLDELIGVSRGLLGVVARSLAPALEDVTVPQFRLIVLVTTLGPTRSVDLAERLAVSTSTLSRNLDRLVAGGWVERRPSETSRREVHIAVTDRGVQLVREVTARRTDELRVVLERVPADERATLARAAELLRTAMREPLPEEVSGFGG
jgi:DNA-binding MarR family transcriptional regulator